MLKCRKPREHDTCTHKGGRQLPCAANRLSVPSLINRLAGPLATHHPPSTQSTNIPCPGRLEPGSSTPLIRSTWAPPAHVRSTSQSVDQSTRGPRRWRRMANKDHICNQSIRNGVERAGLLAHSITEYGVLCANTTVFFALVFSTENAANRRGTRGHAKAPYGVHG